MDNCRIDLRSHGSVKRVFLNFQAGRRNSVSFTTGSGLFVLRRCGGWCVEFHDSVEPMAGDPGCESAESAFVVDGLLTTLPSKKRIFDGVGNASSGVPFVSIGSNWMFFSEAVGGGDRLIVVNLCDDARVAEIRLEELSASYYHVVQVGDESFYLVGFSETIGLYSVLFNMDHDKLRATQDASFYGASVLAMSPSGHRMCAWGDGVTYVVDMGTQGHLAVYDEHTRLEQSEFFSLMVGNTRFLDENTIVSISRSGELMVWKFAENDVPRRENWVVEGRDVVEGRKFLIDEDHVLVVVDGEYAEVVKLSVSTAS